MSSPLLEEEVLVLDCQSTGATPARAHLLEIGWARSRAARREPVDGAAVTAHLLALPEGASIPRQVARITGVAESDLAGAMPPATAWRALADAAADLAAARAAPTETHVSAPSSPTTPTVVHCARFEEAFLRALHHEHDADRPFPLDMVCTLEIARRLLPDLPRRGLRALAGYLGLTVPPPRRAAEHVIATAFIWAHLARLLADEHGVATWSDLRAWLERTPTGRAAQRAYPMPRELRLDVPDQPGVYRMLRGNGDLLYVGKATSLRRRVNSYFQKQSRIPDRTLEMLTQARDLRVTVTSTTVEAALLESDEIKKLAPPYNVALRVAERALCYASPHFDSLAPAPDARHRIGPLPGRATATAFDALVSLLAGTGSGIELGIPEDRVPDAACLADGLRLFREACLDDTPLDRTMLPGALLRIGARSWQQRLEEARRARAEFDADLDAEPVVADSDPEEPDPGSEPADATEIPEWTPERVAAFLEGLARNTAHQVRRARWLCQLSDACVVWSSPAIPSGSSRLLVLERGLVARRDRIPRGTPPPTPPGFARRRRDRQHCFDVGTYDRLRVLTTELRRLVGDRDAVAVRLAPNVILTRDRLEKKLEWV